MFKLRALAAFAITASVAQTGILVDRASSAQQPEANNVAVGRQLEPQMERADRPPVSCPYHFGSDMPAGTFCVYQGVALASAGAVCATDVVVVWSSVAAKASLARGSGANPSPLNREVYLGVVADPELVLRATVMARRGDRAEMVDYTLGSEEAAQPLSGWLTLRAGPLGSADVLSMDLREPRRFKPRGCAFASYSGTFLGMIETPREATTSVDPYTVRRP